MGARLSRRRVLAGTAGVLVAGFGALPKTGLAQGIAPSRDDRVRLLPQWRYDLIVRWGDALFADVPDMTSDEVSSGALLKPGAAKLARRRFGVNCDGAHFFPMTADGQRGVLCVNNEYPGESLMFPDWPRGVSAAFGARTRYIQKHPEAARTAMESVGVSAIEIERTMDGWRPVKGSTLNRRYTATTPIRVSGPAAGSEWLMRQEDPAGMSVRGTTANCAAGRTPWGTYLTAEENIQEYFGHYTALTAAPADPRTMLAHERLPLWPRASRGAWEVVDQRFHALHRPRESLGFGWIVEIDPTGRRAPVKRTALGRFLHESATCVLARNRHPVVYSADDDHFECLYKFVAAKPYDPARPDGAHDLLDHGTLFTARLNDDGTGEWRPLSYNDTGPLNRAAGFRSQADVSVMTRRAASAVGATPLDRPEDIAVDEKTGYVYVACTRNAHREAGDGHRGVSASNPRPQNRWGHILEIREDDEDPGSLRFRWEIFILAGDPKSGTYLTSLTEPPLDRDACYFAGYNHEEAQAGIGSPDNLALDREGNLWIVTDGPQPGGANNGCFVATTRGPERGRLRQVMSAPVKAEVCGCSFADDEETLFLSIQHPGEGGSVGKPISHWPDGGSAQPRSSVIAVTAADRGPLAI